MRNHNRLQTAITAGRWLLWLLVLTLMLNTILIRVLDVFRALPWIERDFQVLLLAAPLAGLAGALLFYFTARATVRNTDSRCNGKNRLEAAFELQQSNHPLEDLQRQQTEEFYRQARPFPKSPAWIMLCGTLLLAFCVNGVVFSFLLGSSAALYRCAAVEEASREKSAGEGEDAARNPEKSPSGNKQNPAAAREEFAKLVLTAPEAETRATPMDEISWEGQARGPAEFTKLQLHLYVNAREKKTLEVTAGEAIAPAAGESAEAAADHVWKIGGKLSIEELEVYPYDLVSYHLSGETVLNGKPARVLSTPHFIEIRPFREETLSADLEELRAAAGGDGQFDRMVALIGGIHQAMKMQLALNKALFVVRTSGLDVTHPEVRKQLELLSADQKKLRQDIDDLAYQAQQEEGLPESLLENLRQSARELEAAYLELERMK